MLHFAEQAVELSFRGTHRFGFVQVGHLDVAPVMPAKVQRVHWEAEPQVKARDPHQDCVLKAQGEVWIFCVPCQIPILGQQNRLSYRKSQH